MKQFFITGTSSGIGKALAQKALEEGHKVVGISRRNAIEHPNYRHFTYDLSNYQHYNLINFNVNKSADELVLINNAGWLGEVKPLGAISPRFIERAYQVNVIAPSILSKLFIEQTAEANQRRTVINISSGAANYPVQSWSTYCASKAAINSLTRVMQLDHPDVRCMAIAPGVVDTEMQGEIRQVDNDDFPDKQRFVDYKNKGQLTSPAEVAIKILNVLDSNNLPDDSVFSLRDL
jgi:benzil reductase ((S)-benzoin forming)